MLACLIVLCVPFMVADPPTHALTLSTGEVLRGHLIEQTADQVVFEHPVLGRLVLSANDVKGIVDLTVDKPADQPAPVDAEPPDEAVPKPPAAPKWKSRVDIGFTGSAGVSQDSNLRASFRTELDTPEIRHRVDAGHKR